MQRKMQMPKITERKMHKKCNFQRCIFSAAFFCNLRRCIFSVAFFCNFDQLLHFSYGKKNGKKAKTNATTPKQMQRKMRKKCNFQRCIFWVSFYLQLATSHFLSYFFLFETCDIAFSNLLVFGKLLQQATHLGAGKLRKISLPKKCCAKTWPWASITYLPLIRAGEKRNSTVALF